MQTDPIRRPIFIGLAVAGLWATFGSSLVAYAQEQRGAILTGELAQRYGLRKSWLVQAQVDRATDQIANVALDGDAVVVMTNSGVLQLIDAESGTTRWIVQFGSRAHPATGPGVGQHYVAMTKGSRLYVVDRHTGKEVLEKSLQHVPSAAPAVWDKYVYVPLFNGMISTYDISRPRSAPWNFRSSGHVEVQPLVTPTFLAWANSNGVVYASSPTERNVRFQFHTNGPIHSQLAYEAPLLFVCSLDENVYALNDQTGRLNWRFAAGDSIRQSPVAIRGDVFIVTDHEGMYCVSANTGIQKWFTPRVDQFLAASPRRATPLARGGNRPDANAPAGLNRIYAADETGNTMILDATSGARLDTIPTAGMPWKITNATNDSLYLGSRSGLIQCLHEIGRVTPTFYTPVAGAPDAAVNSPANADEPATEPRADGESEPSADPFEEP